MPMLQKTTLKMQCRQNYQQFLHSFKWTLSSSIKFLLPAGRLFTPLNGEFAVFKAELVRGVLVQHQGEQLQSHQYAAKIRGLGKLTDQNRVSFL